LDIESVVKDLHIYFIINEELGLSFDKENVSALLQNKTLLFACVLNKL
jgi:hypothetical protein